RFHQDLLKAMKTVFALAFSPDGKTLASASAEGVIVLWDLSKQREVRRLDRRPHFANLDDRQAILSKKLSMLSGPNGPAGGGQGIWDEREIPHLAFSPDGKTLLAATLGFFERRIGTAVTLWDVATGKELRHVEAREKTFAASTALSLDGKAVA